MHSPLNVKFTCPVDNCLMRYQVLNNLVFVIGLSQNLWSDY